MAKNRDWVDYANLASNVVQNAQLDGLNTKMHQLAELELQKDYREQQEAALANHENLLRETVFVYTEQLRDVEEVVSQNPIEAYIRASHLKRLYAEIPQFKTTGFRKFEDKERLANVQRSCDRLIRDTAARLNPGDLGKCNQCVDHLFRRKELVQLIVAAQMREQLVRAKALLPERLATKRAELEGIKAKQQQNKKPIWLTVCEGFAAVGSAVVGLILLIGILYLLFGEAHAVDRFTEHRLAGWVGVLIAMGAVVGALIFMTNDSAYARRRDELIRKAAALESNIIGMTNVITITEAEISKQMPRHTNFGMAQLEDYQSMLRERDALLTQMLGDFAKSFIQQGRTPVGTKFEAVAADPDIKTVVEMLMALGFKQIETDDEVLAAQTLLGAQAGSEALARVRACLNKKR